MVTPVIVVLDEAADVRFAVAGQVVVFEQNAVLERLTPALDLAADVGPATWRSRRLLVAGQGVRPVQFRTASLLGTHAA